MSLCQICHGGIATIVVFDYVVLAVDVNNVLHRKWDATHMARL
jgi:hypothetical protein